MGKHHDYKDTIRQAAEIDSDADGDRAYRCEKKQDAEIAYETFALATNMNQFGLDEEFVNLMELQFAQELLYRKDPSVAHNIADSDIE